MACHWHELALDFNRCDGRRHEYYLSSIPCIKAGMDGGGEGDFGDIGNLSYYTTEEIIA